jgi:hypothetical protein
MADHTGEQQHTPEREESLMETETEEEGQDELPKETDEELMRRADNLLASPASTTKEGRKSNEKSLAKTADTVAEGGPGSGSESGSGAASKGDQGGKIIVENDGNLGGAGAGGVTGGVTGGGTGSRSGSNTGSAKERANSVGISNLVGNLTIGNEGDEVFGKSPGVPKNNNKNNQARIQSGTNPTNIGIADSGSVQNSKSSAAKDQAFPAAYSTVRKSRAKLNPYTELGTVDGNRRKLATCAKPLPGFELPNDDRQYGVKNFHIPTLRKNVSSSVSRGEGGLFCVTCESEHTFEGNEPICVIISDQNFPPSLPTNERRCCVVIRLEDCMLSEQPGLLKEFFGNRSGYLPEGSLLLFGSLSHLAARGLENYAEEVVRTFKSFANMLSRGCSVTHNVIVPLGGIDSEGLIRDLYDLDCWLRSGAVSTFLSLPNARAKLWTVVRDENNDLCGAVAKERVLFLPESYTNSRKIKTISGEISNVPVKIKPLSAAGEASIISALMNEINETYAMGVDPEPDLDRCSGSRANITTEPDGGRIIVIGASHANRILGGLEAMDLNTVNLTKPGWVADKKSVEELKAKLVAHKIGPEDLIIIDPLSNDTFCGTDDKGNPADPTKYDGKWHITGNLSVRPKTYLKNTLNNLKFVHTELSGCKLIILMPLPRYIKNPCCAEPDHVTNITDTDYEPELNSDLEMVEDLLIAWGQQHPAGHALIHFRGIADDPAATLSQLTIKGTPFWDGSDPVHCTSATYEGLVAAIATAQEEFSDSESAEPAKKRPRLESVVVTRDEPPKPVPPPGATSRPQGWSSGKLPARPATTSGEANGGRGRPYGRGQSNMWRGLQGRGRAYYGSGRRGWRRSGTY